MVWTNDDGLRVRFGTERSAKAKVWEYTTDGPERLVELHVPEGDYPLIADGPVVQSYEVKIPAGAHIESVEVVETTTIVSATGTIDVGLAPVDGDNADPNGLIDAIEDSEIATGGENVAGWVGDLVGTTLTETSHVTLEVNTDEIDSGEFVVRIKYSFPVAEDDSLIQS